MDSVTEKSGNKDGPLRERENGKKEVVRVTRNLIQIRIHHRKVHRVTVCRMIRVIVKVKRDKERGENGNIGEGIKGEIARNEEDERGGEEVMSDMDLDREEIRDRDHVRDQNRNHIGMIEDGGVMMSSIRDKDRQ